MPNHVTTNCIITGPSEEIERFYTTIIRTPEETEEVTLDFNLVIPMPDVLKSTDADGDVDLGIEVLTGEPRVSIFGGRSESYLDMPWVQELGITTIEELRLWAENDEPDAIKSGEAALAAYGETGFYDWYDWRTINWGTKWNSYSFRMDAAQADGKLSFQFDTAGGFPIPIFEKLARMFPGLCFQCSCFDEGWCFAGRGAFNGEPAFQILEATDELYEIVYGYKPSWHDEEHCGNSEAVSALSA